MKLSYRGTCYDYTPAQTSNTQPEVTPTDLHYRGATYRLGQVAKGESLSALMKYRGVAYSAKPTTQTAPVQTPAAVAPSVQAQVRSLAAHHYQDIKNRQRVMLSRSASGVGLASNVATYWNHIQGQIHPTFRMNYDRSHAALS